MISIFNKESEIKKEIKSLHMAQFLVKQNEIAPYGVIFNETKYKLNEKKNKKKIYKIPILL